MQMFGPMYLEVIIFPIFALLCRRKKEFSILFLFAFIESTPLLIFFLASKYCTFLFFFVYSMQIASKKDSKDPGSIIVTENVTAGDKDTQDNTTVESTGALTPTKYPGARMTAAEQTTEAQSLTKITTTFQGARIKKVYPAQERSTKITVECNKGKKNHIYLYLTPI